MFETDKKERCHTYVNKCNQSIQAQKYRINPKTWKKNSNNS
jgi:hypothetical protein